MKTLIIVPKNRRPSLTIPDIIEDIRYHNREGKALSLWFDDEAAAVMRLRNIVDKALEGYYWGPDLAIKVRSDPL